MELGVVIQDGHSDEGKESAIVHLILILTAEVVD
jgi:hypothetical protein